MSSPSSGAGRRPWQVVAIGVGAGSLAGLSLLAAGVRTGAPAMLSLLAGLLSAAGVAAWLGGRGAGPEVAGSRGAGEPRPAPVPEPANESGRAPVVPMAPLRSPRRPVAADAAKVLLVDRDPHFVALATSRLAESGHEVRVAASVREARQVAAGEAGTVEVVVVDLALGEEHGIEAVVERVRRRERHLAGQLLHA